TRDRTTDWTRRVDLPVRTRRVLQGRRLARVAPVPAANAGPVLDIARRGRSDDPGPRLPDEGPSRLRSDLRAQRIPWPFESARRQSPDKARASGLQRASAARPTRRVQA